MQTAALVVVDVALKGLTILIVATIAIAMMRRASAAARHLAWMLTMLCLLILPLLAAAMPGWHVLPQLGSLDSSASPQVTADKPLMPPAPAQLPQVLRTLPPTQPSVMDSGTEPTPALLPTTTTSAESDDVESSSTSRTILLRWVFWGWLAGAGALPAGSERAESDSTWPPHAHR